MQISGLVYHIVPELQNMFSYKNAIGVDLPDPIQRIPELKTMGGHINCAAMTSIVSADPMLFDAS